MKKGPVINPKSYEFSHKYTKLAIMPTLALKALLLENKNIQ